MVKNLNGSDSIIDKLNSHDLTLAGKANQSDLNSTNANVSANATTIATKADKTYVDTQNALKADKSYADSINSQVQSNTSSLAEIAYQADTIVSLTQYQSYTVKDANGNTDWIPAFNQAINYISANYSNGGVIKIPNGVFTVSPVSNTNYIQLKSNISIIGNGDSSIIKVNNNVGDYKRIFGNNGIAQNVSLRNFKVDQNPSGNTTCNITSGSDNTKFQFVAYFDNFQNILVKDCTFDPYCGVNALSFSNVNGKYVTVRNNTFHFVRGYSTMTNPTYDNSAVYLDCANHIATGNRFYADLSQNALGGIETHNGESVINNNVFENYSTGVNIVNQATTPYRTTSDINVSGNTINNSLYPIQLWSITGSSLKNVVITDNVISINQVTRNANETRGISIVPNATTGTLSGEVVDLIISNNTLIFEVEPSSGRSGLKDDTSYGIGLSPVAPVHNATITKNIIRNAPTKGISVGGYNDNFETRWIRVSHNSIMDAGCNIGAINGYRAAIFIMSTVKDVSVNDNTIIDSGGSAPNGYQSIRAQPTSATNVSILRNSIQCNVGGLWTNINTTMIPNNDMGQTPQIKYVSVYPPTTGTYNLDDVMIVRGSVSNGQTPIGYKVTGAGTFGTLNGLTGTISAGAATVTNVVGDMTQLHVGDVILVAGSNAAGIIQYMDMVNKTITLTTTVPNAATGASISWYAPKTQPFGILGKVSTSDQALTTTTATQIATMTPLVKGNFEVKVYYRVLFNNTTVTITLTFTDGTGSQTINLVNGVSQPPGSYTLTPIMINATTTTAITVTATAGTASQVFVSSTIKSE